MASLRHPSLSGRLVLVPLLLLAPPGGAGAIAAQQWRGIPLEPSSWTATDSLRFETHLGRPALYIDRGVALAEGIELEHGTFEFSVAATARSNFYGAVFHARATDFFESIFFRVGQSGTPMSVQYGPALNGLGAAWQLYNGPGATAVATLERDRWMRVRIELDGAGASLFLDDATEPTLVVPRLAGSGGRRLGVWTGLFGRGAYFSDFRYAPAPRSAVAAMPAAPPPGTLADWELSPTFDGADFGPAALPDLDAVAWERVRVEPSGIVLVNRYRVAPAIFVPFDPETRRVDVDSVLGNTVTGTAVVFARTYIDSERDEYRRMHFGYSDGVTIFVNRQPLFFGMNAQFFRGDGIMSQAGDAVFLPLRRGRNEIVLAVTEYTGGWGFWARVD